ncbi:MAG: type II toxin-antitoxin system RelE family toxin [Janthinobacterium lividum]
MSTYKVKYAPSADRQLTKIGKRNPQAASMIKAAVKQLEQNPRSSKSTNIVGSPGEYRLDVRGQWGSFRVRYEVNDGKLLVLVLVVGDRKNVYQ